MAVRQHNVFHHDQAIAAGMSERAIRRRLENQDFIALHPRVYTLPGLVMTSRSHLMAACLWSGTGRASHRSAASLYGLTGFTERWRPEITVTTCHLPPRSGVIVHHTDRLPKCDVAMWQGIPTISIERTLLDLGAVAPRRHLAFALDDALTRGLTTLEDLDRCLQRTARRGRRGCRPLRELIKQRSGMTRFPTTALETEFFQAALEFGLPRPVAQHEILVDGEFVARPDFAWPERRLAVEMDSYEFHGGRDAFEHDRKRLNRLTLLGWTIVHGTWRQLREDPATLMEQMWKAWQGLEPDEAAGRDSR